MSEAEHGQVLDDDTALVWVAQTMVEAQIAEAALSEAGVPCILQDFSLNPYDGVLVLQQGWARILVGKRDVERSRKIIERALQPMPLRDEDEWKKPEGPFPRKT